MKKKGQGEKREEGGEGEGRDEEILPGRGARGASRGDDSPGFGFAAPGRHVCGRAGAGRLRGPGRLGGVPRLPASPVGVSVLSAPRRPPGPPSRPPPPAAGLSDFPLPRPRRQLRGGRPGAGRSIRVGPGRARPCEPAAGRPGRPAIRIRPGDARAGRRAPPGGRFYIASSFLARRRGKGFGRGGRGRLPGGRRRCRPRPGGGGAPRIGQFAGDWRCRIIEGEAVAAAGLGRAARAGRPALAVAPPAVAAEGERAKEGGSRPDARPRPRPRGPGCAACLRGAPFRGSAARSGGADRPGPRVVSRLGLRGPGRGRAWGPPVRRRRLRGLFPPSPDPRRGDSKGCASCPRGGPPGGRSPRPGRVPARVGPGRRAAFPSSGFLGCRCPGCGGPCAEDRREGGPFPKGPRLGWGPA